jgi:hypothetical protein
MSESGVRRGKAALSSGWKSHPATAPAGSSRSSYRTLAPPFAFGSGGSSATKTPNIFLESSSQTTWTFTAKVVALGTAAFDALFAMMFKWLPDAHVDWRNVLALFALRRSQLRRGQRTEHSRATEWKMRVLAIAGRQRLGNLEKKSQITTGESKSSPSSGMACPPFCTEYKMTTGRNG